MCKVTEKALLKTADRIRAFTGNIGTKKADELLGRMEDLLKDMKDCNWQRWIAFCNENGWSINCEAVDFFA